MADRPTASTITDAQLDALHVDLERARRIAVQLENDNSRLEAALRSPHAVVAWGRAHARAERAEQQLDQHTALLTEYVHLADITHKYGAMGGHDSLGKNLTCAGCDLRDRSRAALDGAQQTSPDAELRRPGCIKNGVRYRCQDDGCECQQPGPDGDRLILDGRTLPVLSHWREQGPTSDGREKWGVVTQQPSPDGERSGPV